MENLYLTDCSGISLSLYVVTDFIRFEQEYQNAAGKILKRAAQRHTDSDTGRSEDCYERRGFYAKDSYDRHYKNEVQDNSHHAEHECGQRAVQFAAIEKSGYKTVKLVDDKLAHIEDHYGQGHIDHERHRRIDQTGHKIIERQGRQHGKLLTDCRH